MKDKKCYMCDATATTEEHVPPKAFFPDILRKKNKNFIIVPSCCEHNNSKGKDDEYVRNIICMSDNSQPPISLNDKVKESLVRRDGSLLNRIKQKSYKEINGENINIKTSIEMIRFGKVFSSMAYGIFYYKYGKTYCGEWKIHFPNLDWPLGLNNDIVKDDIQVLNNINKFAKFDCIFDKVPEIFKCYECFVKTRLLYKLVFYQNFVVYIYSLQDINIMK